ncbi:lipopolysaccharide biosynthesis protein [Hyphomonas sp. UBA3601]|jgi:PST family polysaccharide transporter|uniref:lipopolysaccharide biosynthesis protein n=2 Tax=unclassified Hyphomonas TaxID=2630699 RepID=UPI0025C20B99|nr:lipopolysaccharide biosynthesis protein [Hyphomonas sp. UBA3601]|tara:strand:- start:3478 stop:5013 length:1536 start_codon:yes stop_codon:yes gene_type:complete
MSKNDTPPEDDELNNINTTAAGLASGAAITGVAQGFRVVLGFVQGIVLARLLLPADFGLVAMVAPAVAFAAMVKELGLNQATVQRDQISQQIVSNLFWLSVSMSILLAVIMAACAPLLADFYGEPEVQALAVAYAATIVVWGLQSQPAALLARKLAFKTIAIIEVVSLLAGFIVAVATAYLTRSYWALFYGTIVTAAVSTLASWMASKFKPMKIGSAEGMREMIGFGSSIAGFDLLNFASRNADNILIARFHDAVELGLYDRAYKLLLFPLQKITYPLSRVMVPFLSRNVNQPERYKRAYFVAVTIILVAAQPGVLVGILFADEIFLVLLGKEWVPAAPVFMWLGIAGLVQVMTSTMGWLFVSQGRGKHYLMVGAVTAVISITSFVVGLPQGAVGVAAAYAIGDLVFKTPYVWFMASRNGTVRFGDFVRLLMPHLLALAVAAAALYFTGQSFQQIGFLQIGLLLALSYGIYLAVLTLFKEKVSMARELLEMVWNSIQSKRQARAAQKGMQE